MSRVVALAGVGRNTFYECFDDFAHALQVTRSEAAKLMQRELDGVEHNAAWLGEVARVWCDVVTSDPLLMLTALHAPTDRSLSALGSVFADALEHAVAEERGELDRATRFGVQLAAASAEACARGLALEALTRAGVTRQRAATGDAEHGPSAPRAMPDHADRALAASVRALLPRARERRTI